MHVVLAALAHAADTPGVAPVGDRTRLAIGTGGAPQTQQQRPLWPGSLLAGSTLKDPISFVTLGTLLLAAGGAGTVADEVQHDLHLLGEAQRFDLDVFAPAVRRTFVRLDRNMEKHLETSRRPLKPVRTPPPPSSICFSFVEHKQHLISDGDVGALSAVLSRGLHKVLADGFVVDGNSLRQFAVFQNHLGGQRLSRDKEDSRQRVSVALEASPPPVRLTL